MSTKRQKIGRLIALLLAVLVVAVACGASDDAAVASPTPVLLADGTLCARPVAEGEPCSCTSEVVADSDRHTEVLIEVQNRRQNALLSIPGVTSMGVGFIYKSGTRTNELGITIFITQMLRPDQANPRNFIPATIEGCTVSVRVGDFRPVSKLPFVYETRSA